MTPLKVLYLRRIDMGGDVMNVQITSSPPLRFDHRETADAYRGVLFIEGNYRVAECREGLQWLFQRKRPRKSNGGAAWDTLAYCTTRKALIRLHRAHAGEDAAEIAALPEYFERRNS